MRRLIVYPPMHRRLWTTGQGRCVGIWILREEVDQETGAWLDRLPMAEKEVLLSLSRFDPVTDAYRRLKISRLVSVVPSLFSEKVWWQYSEGILLAAHNLCLGLSLVVRRLGRRYEWHLLLWPLSLELQCREQTRGANRIECQQLVSRIIGKFIMSVSIPWLGKPRYRQS